MKLRPYQERAVDRLYEHNGTLCLCPVGAGKTVIGGTAASELLDHGELDRVYVVAPKRVAQLVWLQEFEKWPHLDASRVAVALGTPKQRMAALQSQAQIVVINYENLVWLIARLREGVDYHMVSGSSTKPKRGLILDELSKMKAPGSKRFKTLRHVLKAFVWRAGLTGTLTSNNVADVWSQVYCVDEGAHLGKAFTQFRARHFLKTGPEAWEWSQMNDAPERVAEAIAPISFIIEPGEYADSLPGLQTVPIYVELPPDARKVYREMEKRFVTEVGEDRIAASSGGVKSGKLRQLCQGFLYTDTDDPQPTREAERVHDEKVKALQDLIEERQGRPLLVIYEFQEDLAAIKAAIGSDTPHLGQGTTDRQADEAVRRWNAGELPVLLLHPASAGHGLNLQGCPGGDALCWFGLTWSRELYDQTVGRLHRGGQQAETIWNYVITARNTTDADVQHAWEYKLSIREAVESGVRERIAA